MDERINSRSQLESGSPRWQGEGKGGGGGGAQRAMFSAFADVGGLICCLQLERPAQPMPDKRCGFAQMPVPMA